MPKSTIEIRKEICNKFLTGRGIEIGGGMSPTPINNGAQIVQFDIRDRAGLSQYFNVPLEQVPQVFPLSEMKSQFPDGANFLINFHVLEHLANPIQGIIEWVSLLKKDAVLMIGVPDSTKCADKGRLLTPVSHLLDDYFLSRTEASFESKEHVYSNFMGWNDLGAGAGLTKTELAERAHYFANQDHNDIHWHVFSEETAIDLISLSCILANRPCKVLDVATPSNHYETPIDMIVTVQLDQGDDNYLYHKDILDARANEYATALSDIQYTLQGVDK